MALRLAALLTRHGPLDRVFFASSGAEANEGAIKLARKWGRVARGGRYDEVGAVFGRRRPAVGFSLDLKLLAEVAPPTARHAAVRAPWSEDAALRLLDRPAAAPTPPAHVRPEFVEFTVGDEDVPADSLVDVDFGQ